MIGALGASGNVIQATPGARGLCPSCKESVLARCGSINVWHWSHESKECDQWTEPVSAWHLGWQALAEKREVVITRDGVVHRADIVTPDGVVCELQASPISPDEIRERERFYGNMCWLFRVTWDERLKFGKTGGFWWKHGAKSHLAISKPVLWHVADQSGKQSEDSVVLVRLGSNRSGSRVLGRFVREWGAAEFARDVFGAQTQPPSVLESHEYADRRARRDRTVREYARLGSLRTKAPSDGV